MAGVATAPADSDLELPPVVRRTADLIMSVWCKTPGPNWHEDAAVLVVSSGGVREALRAVEQLKALHFSVAIPDRWNTGVTDVRVCNHCRSAWPCADAEILGVA